MYAQHLNTLPFHRWEENVVRAGIYAAVGYAAGASCVIASVNRSYNGNPPSGVIYLNWVLLAIIPFAFVLGSVMAHNKYKHVGRLISRLRATWLQGAILESRVAQIRGRTETPLAPDGVASDTGVHSRLVSSIPTTTGGRRDSTLSRGGGGTATATGYYPLTTSSRGMSFSESIAPSEPNGRVGSLISLLTASAPVSAAAGGPEDFYDAAGAGGRFFYSGPHALLTARVLLYQRDRNDVDFLQYLIQKGMEENPECEELKLFQLLLLRSLVRGEASATLLARERLTSIVHRMMPLEHQFTVYTAERSTAQVTHPWSTVVASPAAAAANFFFVLSYLDLYTHTF